MLYVNIPTQAEFKALNDARSDACVSIYLKTTPISQDAGESCIELGNLAKQASEQLEAVGFNKKRLAALMEHVDDLIDDDEFWRLQANSLAILATPDVLRTLRLPNLLSPQIAVSDRFRLTPLLRSLTFPHSAFVLALSENAVRLVEVYTELPPATVKVDGLPRDAASAVGKATLNDRSPSGRIHGLEGQNVRLRQYARQVDTALRMVLEGRDTPLILAGTGRLPSIYRSVNNYRRLLNDTIENSPDRMSNAELADAARPILDAAYREELTQLMSLYQQRAGSGRATTDPSDAARAATYGAIDVLLVDIGIDVPDTVDDVTGAVSFADSSDATSYGVVDEIAARAGQWCTGARCPKVRSAY